jgi:hypothetical protein
LERREEFRLPKNVPPYSLEFDRKRWSWCRQS